MTYSLINQKDSDVLTILTNMDSSVDIYAKIEGLDIKRKDGKKLNNGIALFGVIVGMISSLLSLFIDSSHIFLKIKMEIQNKIFKSTDQNSSS